MKSLTVLSLALSFTLISGVLLIGCAAHPTSAQQPQATPGNSVYIAMDYSGPGHSFLTQDNIDKIRSVLAEVKPCQRPLVRYAFPGGTGHPEMVMFFDPAPDNLAHVFGRGYVSYVVGENDLIVPPPDAINVDPAQILREGVQWDNRRQTC